MKKLSEYFSKRVIESEPEPKFNNSPNQCIHYHGKDYWISRSAAVVGVVFAIHKDSIFVLAEQRSEKMDAPNKWCVPCGYLDWDETGYEAIVRELYEELKFNVEKHKSHLIFNNEEQPFYVNTKPSENRQNVALTYCLIFDFEKELPKLHKCDEVKDAKWIPLDRVQNKELYDWAFSHDERIEMAVNKFKEKLQ